MSVPRSAWRFGAFATTGAVALFSAAQAGLATQAPVDGRRDWCVSAAPPAADLSFIRQGPCRP